MRARTLTIVAAGTAAFLGIASASHAAPAPPAAAPTFESHWQDGRAELNGYRYTVTRYGQPRRGTAVMVFVTEPFSESKHVKVDDPKKNPKDTFEALKLNVIRDFQTGIYDYNTMTSIYVRSRDFSPVKIAFSCDEWCGQVYEEMNYERFHVADHYASYFEDESETERLTLQPNGLTEEELLIRLRDLRGAWLKPGERRTVPFLPSAFLRRLTHRRELQWSQATIERTRDPEAVVVPAGKFEATRYTVRVKNGPGGVIWIEQTYPHRVVRWQWSANPAAASGGWSPAEGLDGGELTGSARLKYWELHRPGDEKYLEQLGLTAGPGGAQAPTRTAPPPSSPRAPASSKHHSR